MLCGVLPLAAQRTPPEPPTAPQVRHVVTALDHLTVLEYDEPVLQAAAGSSAFQIERNDNKVFIKPLRTGVSTNLFIWTSSNQVFCFELSVGDVATMNAAIHTVSKVAKPETSGQIDQLVDISLSRTLLGAQSIESAEAKPSKTSKIRLRVGQVFTSGNTLYIQYTLENLGTRPYRITTPNVFALELEHPHLNPVSVRGRQLDGKIVEELGKAKEIPLAVAHIDTHSFDIGPGMRQHGIVAVRQRDGGQSPVVLQLVFDSDVKATLVL